MPFGYAEPKRLPIGLGEIYLNKTQIGSLKGNITFHYKPQYAEQKPGNMLSPIKAERISEEVMVDAEICEIKLSQLRTAMGNNQAVASAAVTLRKRQQFTLTGTTAVTTAETMLASSLKVYKLDRSTIYVSSTDYSATSTTVVRKVGGIITTGQVVLVEYNFSDSGSKSVQVGGELTTPNTFDLLLTHELSDGKIVQIEVYKAFVNTDFTMNLHEKSSGNYTTYNVSFKGLVDLTKAEGANLFQITEEDAP